jgi:uncharacterized protein YcgI (DUF1989 family)
VNANPLLRPRFREPGLPSLDPGVERYRLPGLGGLILHLSAGDRVEIIDREGRQTCAIAAFGAGGKPDLAGLGLKGDGDAAGINRLLQGEGENGAEIARALRARGIALGVDRAAILLGGDSRPGDAASLRAERDLVVVFHAPGSARAIEGELPATDLSVFVHRAKVTPGRKHPLPEPLGDLIAEYHVDRCTALSYEVKEGQYIQIIDAEGRQCSDFLARAWPRSSSMSTCSRWSRWCATPSAATTRSVSPAPAASTRMPAIPGIRAAARTSTTRSRASVSRDAPAGRRSTCSTTPGSPRRTRSSSTIPGRGRATTC